MEELVKQRALNLLGMATAARKLISGEEQVIQSIQRQKRKFSDLHKRLQCKTPLKKSKTNVNIMKFLLFSNLKRMNCL